MPLRLTLEGLEMEWNLGGSVAPLPKSRCRGMAEWGREEGQIGSSKEGTQNTQQFRLPRVLSMPEANSDSRICYLDS